MFCGQKKNERRHSSARPNRISYKACTQPLCTATDKSCEGQLVTAKSTVSTVTPMARLSPASQVRSEEEVPPSGGTCRLPVCASRDSSLTPRPGQSQAWSKKRHEACRSIRRCTRNQHGGVITSSCCSNRQVRSRSRRSTEA